MVQGSDVLVEDDKLIDRQLERAAITSITGFAKLYTDAAKVLKGRMTEQILAHARTLGPAGVTERRRRWRPCAGLLKRNWKDGCGRA